MCNCMKEFENNCATEVNTEIRSCKNWTIKRVYFKHTTELFVSELNIPIIVEGLNSKGSKVKKELYYPALYCPFCGKKFSDKE